VEFLAEKGSSQRIEQNGREERERSDINTARCRENLVEENVHTPSLSRHNTVLDPEANTKKNWM
jgi:hypothetical protein